jgi:hypothetical protein
METAQEFIERYLREKSEIFQASRQRSEDLHQKFFGEDYLKIIQDWQDTHRHGPESFEIADASDTSAKITTIKVFNNKQERVRYYLKFSAETWKITNQERECFLCNGAGGKNKAACKLCNGNGWTEFFKK